MFLFVLTYFIGYSQDVTTLKGKALSMPASGYGQDTIQSYIVINKSSGGNAGFVAISGDDTLLLQLDSNGVFRIKNDVGFVPPSITNTERDAIPSPATGLFIYSTTDNSLQFYNGSSWDDVGGSGGGGGVSELVFGSEEIFANLATKTFISSTSTSYITFAGTGGVDNAGVGFIVPEDYGSGGAFYFWATMDGTGAISDTALITLHVTYGASGGTDVYTQVDETLEIRTQTYSGTAWRIIKSASATTDLTLTGGDYMHVELNRDPSHSSDNSNDSFSIQAFIFKYTSQ